MSRHAANRAALDALRAAQYDWEEGAGEGSL